MIDKVAMIAAIMLPLWNIPLIVRIIKRGSSNDISRSWAVGVWICFVLMFPSALRSPDPVWKAFNVVNMVLFTVVVVCTLMYHKKKHGVSEATRSSSGM